MPETGNNIVTVAAIDLVDETFDISQSGSYHLSIQTEPGGLSFCILNTIVNKYIVLRHYPLCALNNDDLAHECRSIYKNDNLLRLGYKSCSHIWVTPRCTLVPEHLFDSRNAGSLLNFNHGWKANESVEHNHLRQAKLYNIFSLPTILQTLLLQYQPGSASYHQATPFVNWVVSQSYTTTKPLIAICYYGSYMDIVVAVDKKLLLYNTFCIQAQEDSVYYLAGVLNLFGMQLASTNILYAGDPKRAPWHLEMLKKYTSRISECEPLDTVTYSHYFTEPLRKCFIHLFNLQGCVS